MILRFLILLFLASISNSCIQLKSTYYNELNEKYRQRFKPQKIDTKNHKNQKSSVYSIKVDDLKQLMTNSNNKFSIVYSTNLLCSVEDSLLIEINNKYKQKDIDIYYLSGADYVYLDWHKEFIDTYGYDKIYLLDTKEYGDIESWHENRTFLLRLREFTIDLQKQEKADSLRILYDDNPYLLVTIFLFDNRSGESLLSMNPFECDDLKCKKGIEDLFKDIDSHISKY